MSQEEYDAKVAVRVAEYHAQANVCEAAGQPMMAGLLRVEASNIAQRPKDWKPIHKPSIGPYSDTKPPYCVHCGRGLRYGSKDGNTYTEVFGDDVITEDDKRYCDQKLLNSV